MPFIENTYGAFKVEKREGELEDGGRWEAKRAVLKFPKQRSLVLLTKGTYEKD